MRGLMLLMILSCAAPLAAQERQRVENLQTRVIPLVFKVTDLSGNPIDVGGKVEDIRVAETATEMTIDLAADVLFDFDKAELLPAAEETLRKAAGFIRDQAKGSVRIEGHTDAKGDDEYNLRLSQRRAESVREWFVRSGGLKTVSFTTDGLGEKKPVAPNQKPDGSDDAEGRQKNRRVQIVISKR